MAMNKLSWWSTIWKLAIVDWLYNRKYRSLFRQMHPTKVGELYVKGSEQGVSVERRNRIYLSISNKVCNFDIYQNVENVSHPYPSRQHNSLEFSMKMGRTKNPELMQISKEIWEFLLGQRIRITAKHLPENLNCDAHWESRYQKDSLESKYWKGAEIGLFTSRSSNQLPSYYS